MIYQRPVQVRLERRGYFELVREGDRCNQCGPEGNNRFRFWVHIRMDDSQLCPRGFIIEHDRIQEYFDSLGQHLLGGGIPSCERMSAIACRDIAVMVGEARATYVAVDVAAAPLNDTYQSGVRAIWRNFDAPDPRTYCARGGDDGTET